MDDGRKTDGQGRLTGRRDKQDIDELTNRRTETGGIGRHRGRRGKQVNKQSAAGRQAGIQTH